MNKFEKFDLSMTQELAVDEQKNLTGGDKFSHDLGLFLGRVSFGLYAFALYSLGERQ